MSTHALDIASFQALFPEFATTNPVTVALYWDMATSYITATDGVILSGAPLQLALNLMTAHLLKIIAAATAGQTTGVVSGATEGSVSVSLQPPPVKSGWQFWLAQTPYGIQLWALLQVRSAGGLHVGGSLERASFRKAGGVF